MLLFEVQKKYRKQKPKNCKDYKNGIIMLLSKCAVRNSKKSRSNKEREASGLLSSLVIKTP